MPKKTPLYPHVPKSRKKPGTEEHRELASKPKKPPLYPHVTKGHNGSGSKENPLGARRFPLGQMVMTRGVADKVAEDTEFAKFVMVSIARHATGDWGDMVKEDKAENELALREGNLRLFSAYEHPRLPKIWIITEADRSVTTVLFPEEY